MHETRGDSSERCCAKGPQTFSSRGSHPQSHGPMGRQMWALPPLCPTAVPGAQSKAVYGKSAWPIKAERPLLWTLAKWPSGNHKEREGETGAAANPCLRGNGETRWAVPSLGPLGSTAATPLPAALLQAELWGISLPSDSCIPEEKQPVGLLQWEFTA